MQNKVPPAQWTYANIEYMKTQLKRLGFALDWTRELATCKPEYYRWEQWLFTRLYEKGLIYQAARNGELGSGRPDRAGQRAGHRRARLAFGRADREARDPDVLHEDHRLRRGAARRPRSAAGLAGAGQADAEELDRQEYRRALRLPLRTRRQAGQLWVFTTRADTIMGVTFCAVAAEHPLATYAAARDPQVAAFVEECKRGGVAEADLATMEKKGLPTGIFVTHPLTGEQVEVWIGNYVLMGYGDGAVMAVPAHDERDFVFARKYGLPIRQVIARRTSRVKRIFDRRLAGVVCRQAARRLRELRKIRRPCLRRPRSMPLPPTSPPRVWARRRCSSACATGASRASATGAARFRSCIAPVVARCRCLTRNCRSFCPKTSPSPAPARRWPGCPGSMNAPARSAAGRRGAKPIPWIPSSSHPGISCAIAVRTTIRRWSTSASPTGARAASTSISAASSTPSCTCSTRASGPS
jgi:hypothetical protein